MIAGELKSKVDKLWTTFWNNGISNPLSVIEQISYLLFIKHLDDLELAKEKKPIDIPDIIKRWQQRNPEIDSDHKAKAFFVPREEIKANAYDLSINRYKEIEYKEVNYEPPKVVLQKFRELEDEIRQDLDALEEMLSQG